MRFAGLALALIFFALACRDFENEIEVELPGYEPQYVVEAYLEPGEPYRLLLTKSDAFFSAFPTDNDQFLENLLIADAEVFVTVNGSEIRIPNQPSFDPFTGKLYNYTSSTLVPEEYENEFDLRVLTADGTELTARTRILPPVPIDSLIVEFDEPDTAARALLYISDDIEVPNYYRRQLHQSSLDSIPDQDFVTPDDFIAGEGTIVFGTGYDFALGDTIISTLYHIDRDYYDFLLSVDNAEASNGNPFGTPGVILGNIENGLGIFTGLSYDQDVTIVSQ